MKRNASDIEELTGTTEIDIMPYYPSSHKLPHSQYNRYVANELDVLSLIWLTKLKIK